MKDETRTIFSWVVSLSLRRRSARRSILPLAAMSDLSRLDGMSLRAACSVGMADSAFA